jgi:chromatin segregation and condensation protein Rec8/ScpA/Scc1 (kleisin family)
METPPAYSIKAKMEEMLERVRESERAGAARRSSRRSPDGPRPSRRFALLELLRMGLVKALQSEEFAEIFLEATGTEITLENYEEAYR